MASASKEIREVEVTYTRSETIYVLELTEDEAGTLSAILNNVGGPPIGSLRQHTDAMNDALSAAGMTYFESEPYRKKIEHGSIFFKPGMP